MTVQNPETFPPPPGVIASLQAGFNVVSNRVALVLLPVLLDVFLWLGPRLSVGKWFGSIMTAWLDLFRRYGNSPNELAFYTANAPALMETFEKLNWLSWIRTLPIGIPALMLGLPEQFPVQTPLGLQSVIQVSSFFMVFGSALALTLAGWLGGGLYFRFVAGATLGEEEAGIDTLRAIIQTFLLSVIWGVGWVVIALPILFLIGLLSMVNALLGQVAFFILMFLMFWLVVPLFFTPHGIFARKQNAFLSVLSSLRMSRFTLPTSSMFVVSVFLLSQGLSLLWQVPANDSWLMLVGIAGHAFISTTLLSASFVYYRDMNNWLQTVYQRFQQLNSGSSIKKA